MHDIIIELAEAGELNEQELNEVLASAWEEFVADMAATEELREDLGVDQAQLQTLEAPFSARIEKAGVGVGEVVIFLAGMVGQSVLSGILDAGRDRVAAAMLEVWEKHLRRKVSPPGKRKIGKRKDRK